MSELGSYDFFGYFRDVYGSFIFSESYDEIMNSM
jgi:hypothetical protein